MYISSGTTVNSLLDSPPCSSSSTCYALTTPVVLHSTKGLLTLSSGAFKASDNTYLAKSINLNNQFVPSINIALNAIGFENSCNMYYSYLIEKYSYSSPISFWNIFNYTNTLIRFNYFNTNNNDSFQNISYNLLNSFIYSNNCYKKGNLKLVEDNNQFFSIMEYKGIF